MFFAFALIGVNGTLMGVTKFHALIQTLSHFTQEEREKAKLFFDVCQFFFFLFCFRFRFGQM